MKQIYHPYQTWEGYKNGMYAPCKDGRDRRVILAIQLLTNLKKLRESMTRVTVEWPNETEQILTDLSISHRAWLGQSACNIQCNVREDETREAWGYLTEVQRKNANRVADEVDMEWRKRFYKANQQLSFFDLVADAS